MALGFSMRGTKVFLLFNRNRVQFPLRQTDMLVVTGDLPVDFMAVAVASSVVFVN